MYDQDTDSLYEKNLQFLLSYTSTDKIAKKHQVWDTYAND